MGGKKKPLVKLMEAFLRFSTPLCFVLLLVGGLGLGIMPLLDRVANVDEKSLMVGSANPSLRRTKSSAQVVGERMLGLAKSSFRTSRFLPNLESALQELGLETYISQHYVQRANCTNVHAILRAPRGDAKESILVVTPLDMAPGNVRAGEWSVLATYLYRTRGREYTDPMHDAITAWNSSGDASQSSQQTSAAGVLLASTAMFVAHLASVEWQAKDLIWVLPDSSCGSLESLQHWAHEYQTPSQIGSRPFGRAGVMQQAVIVEMPHSSRYDTIEVLVEGFDGALPKLDMLRVLTEYTYIFGNQLERVVRATRLIQRPHARPGLPFHMQAPPPYLHKLQTLINFMLLQARGLPTGPHAAVKDLLVDAATARFIQNNVMSQTGAQAVPADLASSFTIGEYLELIIRSLNNLTERVHHSYFLYLLTSTHSFVPVELYIVPAVAFIAILLLQAAAARNMIVQVDDAHPTDKSSTLKAAAESTSSKAVEAAAEKAGSTEHRKDADASDGGWDLSGALPWDLDPKRHKAAVVAWLSSIGTVAAICTFFGCLGLLIPSVRGCQSNDTGLMEQGFVSLGDAFSMQTMGMAFSVGVLIWVCVSASLQGQEQRSSHDVVFAWKNALRLRCAALSASTIGLAALTCVNWALAFLTAGPLAVASLASMPSKCMSGENPGCRPGRLGLVPGFFLLATSPLSQMLILMHFHDYLDPVGEAQHKLVFPEHAGPILSRVICNSRGTTWIVFWAVSIPIWLLIVFQRIAHRV